MKQITIELYEYAELSRKAKERALNDFRETNDDPYMQAHMGNLVMEELDARGVKYEASSINALYSLGHSQGDGLMFEGALQWKGSEVRIKHLGMYYASFSAGFEWYDKHGNPTESAHEGSFKKMYEEVCAKVEKDGYDHIEHMQSEENFEESCEANEWTFEANGNMRNY